jgi:hypothetical protein
MIFSSERKAVASYAAGRKFVRGRVRLRVLPRLRLSIAKLFGV